MRHSAGDAEARAALSDLLRVTRRVMRPPADRGTFWCQEVDPGKMCEWTLSVEEEIRAAEEAMEVDFSVSSGAGGDGGGDGRAAAVNAPAAVAARRRVQDELGDLMFDVLMLGCMCERRLGVGRDGLAPGTRVSIAGAAAAAAAKVKRRCPYSFGRLSRPCPSRFEEERAWKTAKELEKAATRTGAALPPPPPTRSFSERFTLGAAAEGVEELMTGGGLVLGAVIGACAVGFALGLATGRGR